MDRLTAIKELLDHCIRNPDTEYAYSRCRICNHAFWDREEHHYNCKLLQWRAALRDQPSLESVRSEARNAALEEAAKVCAKVASPEHWRPLSREAACIECAAAIRALGSALSPARVAEGVPEGESRWLVERTYAKGQPAERREFWLGATPGDMFHDSFESNGEVWTTNALEAARFSSQKIAETLRYRHFHPEAPVEVCEHLFQCGISPESPAKEQPGEQAGHEATGQVCEQGPQDGKMPQDLRESPDVASMVKRLNEISEGREGRLAHILKDCRKAAALLAKLGQARNLEGYRSGYYDGVAGRMPRYPLLPPPPERP